MKALPAIFLLCVASAYGAWPEALLPPGVRVENAPPGGMTFPVLLAEVVLPVEKDTAPQALPRVALAYSPDGKHLAVATQSDVRLIDVYKNREAWRNSGISATVGLTFTQNGKSIIALSDKGGSAKTLTAADGKVVGTAKLWQKPPTEALRLIPCGDASALVVAPAAAAGSTFGGTVKGLDPKAAQSAQLANASLADDEILLSAAAEGPVLAVLTAKPTADKENKLNYRMIWTRHGENPGERTHAHSVPCPEGISGPAGSVSLTPDGGWAVTAFLGADPIATRTRPGSDDPVILRTGNGSFTEVVAGSANAIVYVGTIPPRGETVEPGLPTDLIVMNPETKEKWYLRGRFLGENVAVSTDGRWIAILADEVPARGARGRGLILLDNQIPGKGEQKIAYTYTTETPPPGPLTMASDGSSIAFVEYNPNHDKTGGPALIINVIR